MPTNRIVAIATAVLSLAIAVLPVLGNFDWQSTAGALAGIAAVATVALKWLDGWQKHEAELASDRRIYGNATVGRSPAPGANKPHNLISS